jgi:hypothetical protein
MITDLLPWPFAQISINPTAIAGTTLWSLALYLGLSPVSHWVMEQLVRWFNFAERSLYTSEAEFERTKRGREAQNAFYASIFSIIPFLLVGALLNYGVTQGLGESWTISVGTIACMVCGLYELGRRHSNDSPNS